LANGRVFRNTYDDRTRIVLGIVDDMQGHLKVAEQHIARLDKTSLHAASLARRTHEQFTEMDSAQRATIEDVKAIILAQNGQNVTPRDLTHAFHGISLMMEEALLEKTAAKDPSVQNFTLAKQAFLDAWHSAIHPPKPSTSKEAMDMDTSVEEKVLTLQRSVDTLTVSAPPKKPTFEGKGKKRAVEPREKALEQTDSEPDEGHTTVLVSASSRSPSEETVDPSTKQVDLGTHSRRKRVKSKAVIASEDEMSDPAVVLEKGATHD
jgi:hypothetical protein